MQIKAIELVLENCEVIKIDEEYIGYVWMRGIREELARLGCNYISMHKYCKEFFIEIRKDVKNETSNVKFDERTPIERLIECADICTVRLIYDDKSYEDIDVPWDEDNETVNKYQDHYISEHGNLYLYVGKKDIEKYLDPYIDCKDWEWMFYVTE